MRPESLVPMAHVADVPRSIAFYERLGFTAGSRHSDPEGTLVWAWLHSERAHLMLARADEPVVPSRQAVLFYLYAADVQAYRSELVAAGLTAGEIAYPFYNPKGEFRLVDPDGYVLMVAHT